MPPRPTAQLGRGSISTWLGASGTWRRARAAQGREQRVGRRLAPLGAALGRGHSSRPHTLSTGGRGLELGLGLAGCPYQALAKPPHLIRLHQVLKIPPLQEP